MYAFCQYIQTSMITEYKECDYILAAKKLKIAVNSFVVSEISNRLAGWSPFQMFGLCTTLVQRCLSHYWLTNSCHCYLMCTVCCVYRCETPSLNNQFNFLCFKLYLGFSTILLMRSMVNFMRLQYKKRHQTILLKEW